MQSIFPSAVKAYNDGAHEVEILGCHVPTNEAGWVGMKLHIYCSPTNVYFGEIQVRELEVDGDARDYFASPAWKGGRDHRGGALSQEWICPGDGNYIGLDEASIDGCPTPWGDGGSLTWNIPNACRAVVGDEFRVREYSHSPQVFTITSSGAVEVTKFGAHVRRYPISGADGIYWRDHED